MNGLQFFVHDDPDAVRIEVGGKLCGAEVENVYRVWKRVALPDILKPVIVDITFVTDADEYGRALLVVMHRYGARVIAESPESSAIAQPLVNGSTEISGTKQSWLRRMILFLREDRSADATLSAQAEAIDPASARSRHGSAEYTEFDDAGISEPVVR